LFLGAGSVIHALADEQNIKSMGGIWKKLPVTYGLMLIGSVALAGLPPFSGFFSKDVILEAAYASGTLQGKLVYFLGVIAAILTAFYSCRLLFFVFHGKTRLSNTVLNKIHEAPFFMMLPLLILAVGSIAIGYVAEKMLHIITVDHSFWKSSIYMKSDIHSGIGNIEVLDIWVKMLPLVAAVIGVVAAYVVYIFAPIVHFMLKKVLKNALILFKNKWYFDELYDFLFVERSRKISTLLWKIVDVKIIDSIPGYTVSLVAKLSYSVSLLQTGYIYHYVAGMIVGIALLVYFYLPW
jgi:NADH-quinone oxidoreductase subunit L